jgi:Protein of unknown function (DUF3592)
MRQYILINSAIVVLGLGVLAVYLYCDYELHQAEKWLKTDAKVTESRLITGYEYATQGRRTGFAMHKHLELIFSFKYAVSGHQYVSSNYYWVGSPNGYEATNEYPVGIEFSAYYNPIDPTEAVVEPGLINGLYLPVSIILLIVGLIGLKQCTFQ